MMIDYELDFLMMAADFLDDRLTLLHSVADQSPDPDAYGEFDRIEYVCGFGFVACQTYMTATTASFRLKKSEAFDRGPVHPCGITIASLVNASANYWKHSSEWPHQGKMKYQATETLNKLEMLGIETDRGQYPIANALYRMLQPHTPRFSRLAPFLIEWRNSLQQ